MRAHALLLTLMLAVPTAAGAQQTESPAPKTPAQGSAPASAGAAEAQPAPDLPVSLDRIRQALDRTPLLTVRGLQEQEAHFRVEVMERRKIEELLATLVFKDPGPTVPTPGGIYAYEQQRLARPSSQYPLSQPFAAFTTGQLLTIAIENLAGRYLGGRALSAVSKTELERAQKAAHEEVARSMAEFCAAQPDGGAGLQVCGVTSIFR